MAEDNDYTPTDTVKSLVNKEMEAIEAEGDEWVWEEYQEFVIGWVIQRLLNTGKISLNIK